MATSDEKGPEEAQRAAELLPAVYDELRQLAAALTKRLRPGQTLQATALVHEAYMRLVGQKDPGWQGRRHFFGAAAQAMRQILIEQARRKASHKHGGKRQRVELCTGQPAFEAATSVAVIRRVCDETPRPIREINPDIPEPFWVTRLRPPPAAPPR